MRMGRRGDGRAWVGERVGDWGWLSKGGETRTKRNEIDNLIYKMDGRIRLRFPQGNGNQLPCAGSPRSLCFNSNLQRKATSAVDKLLLFVCKPLTWNIEFVLCCGTFLGKSYIYLVITSKDDLFVRVFGVRFSGSLEPNILKFSKINFKNF